jgi:hypothetical protein
MNGLLNACFLAILAQLLPIGELDAQELIFSNGFELCLPGDRVFWDGGGDGVFWSNAANWQGDVIPADGDSVSVEVFSEQMMVYDNSLGTRGIRCLDSNRALSVTGGNLEILESGRVSSSISITGGSLKVTGSLRVESQ